MSVWKTVSLSDLVEPVKTWNPSQSAPEEFFDYIDLTAVDQDVKLIVGVRKVSCGKAPSRARQLVAKGDVLVSTVRPNLNGVARVPEDLDGATASTGFCVLRPQPRLLDDSYLFQWVKSQAFVGDMVRKATGASYPAVSDRIVFESRLPLPPLAEQRRIAEVLDRAEGLRAKRRTALAQLDSLSEAIFLDLFGNPATNPKGWQRKRLNELGKITTGGTPPSAKEGMFNGPIPFITPADLESNEPVKRSLTEAGAEESVTVRAGTTLVCCIGATIGKTGKATTRSAFNQQINAVEWGAEVHDSYGFAVIRFFQPTIVAWGASTTLPILKKSAFEKIEVPLPPLHLQAEFGRRLQVLETIRAAHRESLAGMAALFGVLQHRAFRGEL
jgi:type I restriction enzyme, S subunit